MPWSRIRTHTIPPDKFRAAAKREAWYDDDDDQTPNYNPFRKIHRRNKILIIGDEENSGRVPTNRSENRVTPSAEIERRSRNLGAEYMTQRADTLPSSSSNSTPRQAQGIQTPVATDFPVAGDRNETFNTESSDTAVDLPPTEAQGEDGPRRRKGLLQKMHLKKGSRDPEKRRASSGLFQRDKQKFTVMGQLRATILNSWINILLIFVPIGIAVHYAGISKVGVFVINFIAIIPLAAMLSFATEEIALRTGETIGGLLNATFGYVPSGWRGGRRPLTVHLATPSS